MAVVAAVEHLAAPGGLVGEEQERQEAALQALGP